MYFLTHFPKTLAAYCLNILGRLGNLPSSVHTEEIVSRFVFSRDHLVEKKGIKEVKSAAFLPARDNKTSVYRVSGCKEHTTWFIGYWFCEFLRNYKKKPGVKLDSLVGRADFKAETAPFSGGIYEYQPTPHFRHIDIGGWPTDKPSQKQAANLLALRAAGFDVSPIKYRPSKFFKL